LFSLPNQFTAMNEFPRMPWHSKKIFPPCPGALLVGPIFAPNKNRGRFTLPRFLKKVIRDFPTTTTFSWWLSFSRLFSQLFSRLFSQLS
jgi:hypothetical protein